MANQYFDFNDIDPSWKECLHRGIQRLDPQYLNELINSKDWLPGPKKIFNAFSLPLSKVNYVLFGESPYPRLQSANGYAFWDDAVTNLWSEQGLSKQVNRATSLRNILKMLLIAEGSLPLENTKQEEIAKIDKNHLIQTSKELFNNFLQHGFLLLNATPVLQMHSPHKDARFWNPFTQEVLLCLLNQRPKIKFILFGRIAATIDKLIDGHPHLERLYAEHPYNLSFITNPKVIAFFKPLHLLRKNH